MALQRFANNKFNVDGAGDDYYFPSGDGAAGDVLSTDGDGNLSFITMNVELNRIIDGRLTVTTSSQDVPIEYPVFPSQYADSTLRYRRYKGDQVSLYNTSSTAWELHTIPSGNGVTAAIPNTTNTVYDVFLYDNSGTLTLEFVAWTNVTTRATAPVLQDGVFVKSGEANKRLLGSIITDSSLSGRVEVRQNEVGLSNLYNRVRFPLFFNNDVNSYNTTAVNTWMFGGQGNTLLHILQTMPLDSVELEYNAFASVGTAYAAVTDIQGAVAPPPNYSSINYVFNNHGTPKLSGWGLVGYNRYAGLQYSLTNPTTWLGDVGVAYFRAETLIGSCYF